MPVEMASIDNFPEPTCHACKETGSHYLPPAIRRQPDQGQPALLSPPRCAIDPVLSPGSLGSQPFSAQAPSPALTVRVWCAVLPLMPGVFVLEQIPDCRNAGESPEAENQCCFRPCRRPGGA